METDLSLLMAGVGGLGLLGWARLLVDLVVAEMALELGPRDRISIYCSY